MNENALIPVEAPGGSLRAGYDPYPAGGQQAPAPVNPMKMVHLFLRGRYWILILLILVLTPLGTWFGYKQGHTLYRSFGVIQVKPESEKILYTTESNSMIPMFEEYLEAEATLMGSQRVLNQALQDPDWRNWKWPLPDEMASRIKEEMTVTHEAEMLEVTVWDSDPTAAMLAVKTIIRTYTSIYNEQTTQQQKNRDNLLYGRREQLSADVDDYAKKILELALKYGTDDLNSAYEEKHAEQENLSQQLLHLEDAVGLGLGRAHSGTGVTPQESEETMIAKSDSRMAEALKARQAYEQKVQQDLVVDQLLEKNPTLIQDRAKLQLVNNEIQEYKAEYERSVGAAAAPEDSKPVASSGATTRPDLKPQVAMEYTVMKRDYDKCTQDLFALGQDKLRLDDLKAKKAQKETQLQETTARLDQLQVESNSNETRIEVVTDGEEPALSSDRKDTHVQFALLGGSGGFALATMIVTLLGLRDRRMHGPEDTQLSSVRVPMLGMLPTLNSDLADPEQAAMAAHFVHGIRAMLQIKATGDRGRVLAITSPSAHNGKTSLSLALGVSFAGAHSRTLLIDCDFIGRALSSRVKAVARPRLGRVLRHEGLIDEKKLQEGLDQAKRKGKRLGEALMDMGAVSAEKLKSCLDAQQSHSFGVLEAIDGEDLRECIAPTDIPGLSILPLGQANAEHIGSLSPAMIRQVLEATRSQYDVVIVDTGPILGSLEAAMVATQADDVVLVLSNGENRGAAERSLRYLESVGAKVAGFVFNRATPRDFERSDNAQRVSSSADRWRHARGWQPSTHLSGFGPVAQAVARSVGEMGAQDDANTMQAGHNGHNGHNGQHSHNGEGNQE